MSPGARAVGPGERPTGVAFLAEGAECASLAGACTRSTARAAPDGCGTPALRTVVAEGGTAVIGMLPAAAGMTLQMVTGQVVREASASLGIGALLVLVAFPGGGRDLPRHDRPSGRGGSGEPRRDGGARRGLRLRCPVRAGSCAAGDRFFHGPRRGAVRPGQPADGSTTNTGISRSVLSW